MSLLFIEFVWWDEQQGRGSPEDLLSLHYYHLIFYQRRQTKSRRPFSLTELHHRLDATLCPLIPRDWTFRSSLTLALTVRHASLVCCWWRSGRWHNDLARYKMFKTFNQRMDGDISQFNDVLVNRVGFQGGIFPLELHAQWFNIYSKSVIEVGSICLKKKCCA